MVRRLSKKAEKGFPLATLIASLAILAASRICSSVALGSLV